jgi:hypothetical protein
LRDNLRELLSDINEYMSHRGDVDPEYYFRDRISKALKDENRLIDKLKTMIPKRPEWSSDGPARLRFHDDPIRRHAEYFANAIDYASPLDKDALIAMLWVFGEAVTGHYVKETQALRTQMDQILATSVQPIFVRSEDLKK